MLPKDKHNAVEIAFWLTIFALGMVCAVAFGGCTECTLTPKKYMCIAPQPTLLPSDTPAGYGVQEQAVCMSPTLADKQLELLADVLTQDAQIKNRDEFIQFIKARAPQIVWLAEPFYCGSVRAVGCTHGDWLEVLVADCVAHTALAHELVHVYLMRTSAPDGDPEHLLPIWDSESKWMARGHKELCGG